MKKKLWLFFPWVVALVVFVMVNNLNAAEWDLLVIGAGGYDRATWQDGILSSPDGHMADDCLFWQIEGQVKTDAFNLPWELEPTVAIFYQQRNYDFSTPHAPIQKTRPTFYGAMIGLTKEFKWCNVYLVGGMARQEINLHMVEITKSGYYDHGEIGPTWIPVIEAGIYKTFTLFDGLKAGPFIGAQSFLGQAGFDRCRKHDMWYVSPLFGIVGQFELWR